MIRAFVLFLAMALPASAVETVNGGQVDLRALDKISGKVSDLTVPVEGSAPLAIATS